MQVRPAGHTQSVQIKFMWRDFFFLLIISFIIFGLALTTEAQIPDPMESHRGHPWKQLRIHRPHPAALRPSVGVSSKKLAFRWVFRPLLSKTICTLWCTWAAVIVLRGNNIILVTQRNAHSGFDVIGVNQDQCCAGKWELVSVIKNSAIEMTSPELPSGDSTQLTAALFSAHVYSVLRF